MTTLRERYMNEKFEKLRKLILQHKVEESEKYLKEMFDSYDNIYWMLRRCNNIQIIDIHFDDMKKFMNTVDWYKSQLF